MAFFENKVYISDSTGKVTEPNVWIVKVNGVLIQSSDSLVDILSNLLDVYQLKYISSNLWNLGTSEVEVYIEYTGEYTEGIPTLSGPPILITHREGGSPSPIGKAVTLKIGCSNSVQLSTYPPSMKLFEHDRISPKRYYDPNPAVIMEGNRYILKVNGVEYKDNRDNTITYWTGEESRGSLKDIFEQNPELNDILTLNYTYNAFNLSDETTLKNISDEPLEIKYYVDEVNSTRVIKAAGDVEDCVYNRAIYYNGISTSTWDLPLNPTVNEEGFHCTLTPSNSSPVIGVVSPDLIGFLPNWTNVDAVSQSKEINVNVVDGAAIITTARYRINESPWVSVSTAGWEPNVGSPVSSYRITVEATDVFQGGEIVEIELTSSLDDKVNAIIEYPLPLE